MIELSDNYESQNGIYNLSIFDLKADTEIELREFFNQNKRAMDRGQLFDEEIENLIIKLKTIFRPQIEVLVDRHNMIQNGQRELSDKKIFLNHCCYEAIKGVIYATDFYPAQMSVDQYAGVVMKAYEDYQDSVLFSQRIMNVSCAETHQQWSKVSLQIELFGNLLNIPYEDAYPSLPEPITSAEEAADIIFSDYSKTVIENNNG